MHSFRGLFFAFSFLNSKWGISSLESFKLDGNCPWKSGLRERERFPVRHPMPQVNSLSQVFDFIRKFFAPSSSESDPFPFHYWFFVYYFYEWNKEEVELPSRII